MIKDELERIFLHESIKNIDSKCYVCELIEPHVIQDNDGLICHGCFIEKGLRINKVKVMKVSLHDHRLLSVSYLHLTIICSCGKNFKHEIDFHYHQKEMLNKQLEKYEIVVV